MPDKELDEERIFTKALGLSGSDRSRYLSESCDGDEELKNRILALLDAESNAKNYLESTKEAGFTIAQSIQKSAPHDESPGDIITRYRLLEKIGEGGWGVVWMAEQTDPVNRRVALKIFKLVNWMP